MNTETTEVNQPVVGQVERRVRPLVAVLAGTYRQFADWCADNPQDRGIYCDEWPRFAGFKFERIVEVGTFRQRKDALDLWQRVVPMVRPNDKVTGLAPGKDDK